MSSSSASAADMGASPQASPVRPRLRPWQLRLLLLTFGLGFGLIIAEVTLQLLPFSFVPYPRYEPDWYCGSILVPNQQGWQSKEGRAFIQVNRFGFRDREHSLDKPDGTYRIAVLGDSYAEAVQVDIDRTFWSVMRRELDVCLPTGYDRVEVLNFGVSGYGTAQELMMLRHHVWQFSPDLVLLAFLPANDIRNNSKRLEPVKQRPFFHLEEDELELDASFRQDPEWLKHRESLSIFVKDWAISHLELAALVYRLKHAGEQQQEVQEAAQIEAGLSSQIYYPPRNPDWEQAWEITERLLAQMNREVSQRGIPFVVLGVTSSVVVSPDDQPREELQQTLGVDDLFYPDRWLEQVGHEHGFPVIRLSQAMQQHARQKQVHLHGFENTAMSSGHWNVSGHQFAGRRAAEFLCQADLLLPSDSGPPEQ